MRCCRCRVLLIVQTCLVLAAIYLLCSNLFDLPISQESMDVVTTTTSSGSVEVEEWEDMVAKMGEKLVVKRNRNKNARILEYPT